MKDSQTRPSVLDLGQRFLTAHIKNQSSRSRYSTCELQQQCRFSDTGFSTYQQSTARNQSFAEDTVQSLKPGSKRFMPAVFHISKPDGPCPSTSFSSLAAPSRNSRKLQRIPCLAGLALTAPNRRLGATF